MNKSKGNPMSKLGGKLATLPYVAAENSVTAACWFLMHQPKEPENMVARLRTIKKEKKD